MNLPFSSTCQSLRTILTRRQVYKEKALGERNIRDDAQSKITKIANKEFQNLLISIQTLKKINKIKVINNKAKSTLNYFPKLKKQT